MVGWQRIYTGDAYTGSYRALAELALGHCRMPSPPTVGIGKQPIIYLTFCGAAQDNV